MKRSVLLRGTVPILFVFLSGMIVGGCSRFRERLAWRGSPAPPAAVESRRDTAADHYRLGRLYQERSRHREAAAEFRKTLAANPGNIKALNALGVSLDALGQYADAAAVYTKALEVDPSMDYVYNNIGYSRLLSGDRATAAAAFAKALELNPGNAIARNNLSRLEGGAHHAAVTEDREAPGTPLSHENEANKPSADGSVAGTAVQVTAETAPSVATASTNPVLSIAAAPANTTSSVATASTNTVPSIAAAPADHAATTAIAQQATFLVPVSGSGARDPNSAVKPGSVLLRRMNGADLRRGTMLEISNGSGQAKLQTEIMAFLAAEGFQVEQGQTEKTRSTTMILYRDGALQHAGQVAKAFPGNQEMKKTDSFAHPDAKVRVLVGRDMVAQRKRFAAEQLGLTETASR